jgi:serine/threonine protein kinase
LGVILFMMVFGFPPFPAEDLDGDDIEQQREAGFTPVVKVK